MIRGKRFYLGTIMDIRTSRTVLDYFNLLDRLGDPCKSMVNDVLALTFNNRIQNIPKHYYNYVACQKPINVSYSSSAATETGTITWLKLNNLENDTLVRWSYSLHSSSCYSTQYMLQVAWQKKDRWWTARGKYRLIDQRTNTRRTLDKDI